VLVGFLDVWKRVKDAAKQNIFPKNPLTMLIRLLLGQRRRGPRFTNTNARGRSSPPMAPSKPSISLSSIAL
jgi:hypothetical protein